MKLLKEDIQENNVPIELITGYISKGWDEVGSLKAVIDGVKQDFKNSENIVKILQDLSDAYLVCIGQLEDYLDKKDYVDIPETEEVQTEDEEVEEVPVEEPAEIEVDEIKVDDTEDTDEESIEDEKEENIDDSDLDVDTIDDIDTDDDFDLDFDDADIDDEDISKRKEWLNK